MSSRTATLMLVTDNGENPRVVVTDADDELWFSRELWADVTAPNRERIPGDVAVDGDLLTFGTEGEGLGRLTYRRTSDVYDYGLHFIACSRVDRPATSGSA